MKDNECALYIFFFYQLLFLQGSVNFKFGVLYAKDGQLTDDEMFSNGKSLHTQLFCDVEILKH